MSHDEMDFDCVDRYWIHPETKRVEVCDEVVHTQDPVVNAEHYGWSEDEMAFLNRVTAEESDIDNAEIFDFMFARGWVRVAYRDDRDFDFKEMGVDHPDEKLCRKALRMALDMHPSPGSVCVNGLAEAGLQLSGDDVDRFVRHGRRAVAETPAPRF